MTFAVFVHRADSIYDDSPAVQYQFPKQYLGRVHACLGDWIVYYEPVKVPLSRGYFAFARVQARGPDVLTNGIALSGTAHWMFDRGLISLTDDLSILVSRQVNDQQSLATFLDDSGRARAPARMSERPHPQFLGWHREHSFKR